MNRIYLSVLHAATFSLTLAWAAIGWSQVVEWTRYLGTRSDERNSDITIDVEGNLYISGDTGGSLGGPNAGGKDSFVSKLDSAGTLQWARQFGTSSFDYSTGISADGIGNVFIAGGTLNLLGGPIGGHDDAFVTKYDASGVLQWTRQFGTSAYEFASDVSADNLGNVYVSGGVDDGNNIWGFVNKFDALGTLKWARKIGTSSTLAGGVFADNLGNVYVTGDTADGLGGPGSGGSDVFLSKYNATGSLLWTQQFGSSDYEGAVDVVADGLGNVFVTGSTPGSLNEPNAGMLDVFVSKFDTGGTHIWTHQLGSSYRDYGQDLAVDGLGNVYFSGDIYDSPDGPHPFVGKFDTDGALKWFMRLDTEVAYNRSVVAADGLGNVFLSGTTNNNLAGGPGPSYNVYITKIRDVPEPTAFVMAIAIGLQLLVSRSYFLCYQV